jgi:hypothetical protein
MYIYVYIYVCIKVSFFLQYKNLHLSSQTDDGLVLYFFDTKQSFFVVSASLLAQAAGTSGADDDGAAAGKENTGMDTGTGVLGCRGFGGKVVTMECWCWGAGWGGGVEFV